MPSADAGQVTVTNVVDLRGVRAGALAGVSLTALVVTWVWMVWTGRMLDQSLDLQALLGPASLFVAAGIVLLLPRLHPVPRMAILLGGAAACFAAQYLHTGDPAWLYYQVLVILLSVPLADPPAPFVLAAVTSLLLYVLSGLVPAAPPINLVPVLVLLWIAAGISWAGARTLYTVLGWALASQADAWRTATEVIKRREQLRRTLDSLHHAHSALERTSRELEAARMEAEEARQVKARFVANISHELRTPLNVIVGFAEMLCTSPEVYGDFTWPPDLREDLLTIWHNARHLLSMVDDVLDLAQIEAAHLPVMPEPTDINQLIRDALDTIGPLLRNASLGLRISLAADLPLLNLDRTRIRQVLLNLTSNAARFTSTGYVQVGTVLRDDAVLVYVRDTGPGIPKAKLETIFDEFEQVDTSIRRPHQGAGLGLAISRQFLRLHGGRIWAESAEGEGSTFFFTLPLPGQAMAVQPRIARRPMPATAGNQPEAQAVMLSSDPIAMRVLERHLADLPVTAAASEEEAVAIVLAQHPEAVLILAENGEMAAATDQAGRILEAVKPADLTVAVCTVPTERGAGAVLGVPELLIKPVAAADLLAAVRKLRPNPSRVLIIDDDPDTVRLFSRLLRREWRQIELLTAGTGEAAIRCLPQCPDLILLDLQLPDTTGVEILRAARGNPLSVHTPVVVVTARGPAQELLPSNKGRIEVLRNSAFSATETVRFLGLVVKALPPRYAAPTSAPSIRGVVPA
ncbi:MAG: ATP-binding response regulator [Anaerolineae bacterium]